jgi:hypothetical protein
MYYCKKIFSERVVVLRALNEMEIKCANGGFIFAPFVWGTIVGAITYAVKSKNNEFNA